MKTITPIKFALLKLILIILMIHFITSAFSQNSITTHEGSTQGFPDATDSSAKFKAQTGISMSTDGQSIYIADYSGHRIRKIDVLSKIVNTIPNNGTSGYSDGSGIADNTVETNEKFFSPTNLKISPDGKDINVADQGNFKVRKIKTDLIMAAINQNGNNLSFQVYPNPTTELIIISAPELTDQQMKLELFNSSGNIVLQDEKSNFDGTFIENVSALPRGIYLLRLSGKNIIAITKIIVTK